MTYEHANSAFLCVGPQGEDYLTYAGSTELTQFGGWGHARIGAGPEQRSRALGGSTGLSDVAVVTGGRPG